LYGSIITYIGQQNTYSMKNKLKVERAIKNITQEELAKQIGVTRQAINSIELNKYVPSTVLALKLSQYFNKTVNEIFFLEESD
jgi:putative transcriptional regulator